MKIAKKKKKAKRADLQKEINKIIEDTIRIATE